MAEKHALREEILRLVSNDRRFAAQFWKALISDRDNVRALNEALHTVAEDGGKLPSS